MDDSAIANRFSIMLNDLKESDHDLHLQISSLESRLVLLETYIEQHIKK